MCIYVYIYCYTYVRYVQTSKTLIYSRESAVGARVCINKEESQARAPQALERVYVYTYKQPNNKNTKAPQALERERTTEKIDYFLHFFLPKIKNNAKNITFHSNYTYIFLSFYSIIFIPFCPYDAYYTSKCF